MSLDTEIKLMKLGVCWHYAGRLSLILETGNRILSAEAFISTNLAVWREDMGFLRRKNITVLHRQDHKLSSEVHLPCGILKQTKRLRFSEAGS